MNCSRCGKTHNGSFGSGKYCSLSCANSRVFSDASKEKKRIANKNQVPWNLGKKWSKKDSKFIGTCGICGEEIFSVKSKPKKYHANCWLKSSGGYRFGSGIGKKGWYKGIWCDSSYELVWVIFQMEHNLEFLRNKDKFSYFWEGKQRNYIPDFIQNGFYIEIKGYIDKQVEEKIKVVKNLIVLQKEDLVKEFDYVYNKYGKNFIELYEKK